MIIKADSIRHTKKKMEYNLTKQLFGKLTKKGLTHCTECDGELHLGDRILAHKGTAKNSLNHVYHVECARELWII